MWVCEDVSARERKWRCEYVKMWRWTDVKMRRCEDEQMWRWADVKMSRCEDEKVWRWEDVKMRRCERRREDEKVWRWEDEIQTPTIGRTLRSDALGKKFEQRTRPKVRLLVLEAELIKTDPDWNEIVVGGSLVTTERHMCLVSPALWQGVQAGCCIWRLARSALSMDYFDVRRCRQIFRSATQCTQGSRRMHLIQADLADHFWNRLLNLCISWA